MSMASAMTAKRAAGPGSATAAQRPLARPCVLLEQVSYRLFEELSDALAREGSQARLAYSGGRLEIMTPLHGHELQKKRVARLIEILALEWDLEIEPWGSTTLKDLGLEQGAEPDEAYFVGAWQPGFEPERPNLVLETEYSRGALDKLAIYAALGIAECWRVRTGAIQGYRLTRRGYEETQTSALIPGLSLADLAGFVFRPRGQETALAREFVQWAKANRPDASDTQNRQPDTSGT